MLEGLSTGQITNLYKTLVSKLPIDKLSSLFKKKKDISPEQESLEKPIPPSIQLDKESSSNTQKVESSEGVEASSVASTDSVVPNSESKTNVDSQKIDPTQSTDEQSNITESTSEIETKPVNSSEVQSVAETSDQTTDLKHVVEQPVFDKEALMNELKSQLYVQIKDELLKELPKTSSVDSSSAESVGDFGKIKQLETQIEKANGLITEQNSKIKEYSKKIDEFEKKTEEFNLAMYELTTKKFNPFITQANSVSTDSKSELEQNQSYPNAPSYSSQNTATSQHAQQSSNQPSSQQQTHQTQQPQYQNQQNQQQGLTQQYADQQMSSSTDQSQQHQYVAHSQSNMPNYDDDTMYADAQYMQSEPAYAHSPRMNISEDGTQSINVHDSISGQESSLHIPKQDHSVMQRFVEQANKLPTGINSVLHATEKISIEDTVDVPSKNSDEIRERIVLEERWNDPHLKKHPEQIHPKMQREDLKNMLHTFMHKHDAKTERTHHSQKKHPEQNVHLSQSNVAPAQTEADVLQNRYTSLVQRIPPEKKANLKVRLSLARLPNDISLLRKTNRADLYDKISDSLKQLELVVRE